MNHQTEIELKFLVPPAARAALLLEMAKGPTPLERTTLAARYLDTPDRRLARAGLSWRLRLENGRWVQTLKAVGQHALQRFEHDVMRPDSSPDAAAHAGTAAGERLLLLLQQAHAEGVQPIVRFQTEVRRSVRRLQLRGAVVEVAFDEGRLLAPGASQRIREIEFELKSGSVTALVGLAERWRKRFALVLEPRSKAERGDRLAGGSAYPAVRRAAYPSYSAKGATSTIAFGAVLDECLAQVTHNALGLSQGDPACRVEHVHQMRVGIRRLRSALRSFKDWSPAPPARLLDDTRALFAALGQSRDSDVMDSGVVAELARAGAPPLSARPAPTGPAAATSLEAPAAQQILLAWTAWMAGRAAPPNQPPTELTSAELTPAELRDHVVKRLHQWHARIAADLDDFENLDEAALHALRKRVKRQRYAVEFFLPLLRARQVSRYLRALAELQDQMGALNDLFVARARYQALVATDTAAWFALGWLAARIAQARSDVKPALALLAKTKSPGS